MTAARGQFVRQFTSAYEACAFFFFPPQGRKLHFFLKGTCRQCVKNKNNSTGTKCCPSRLRSLLGSREEPPPAGACTTGGVGCNWSEVCVAALLGHDGGVGCSWQLFTSIGNKYTSNKCIRGTTEAEDEAGRTTVQQRLARGEKA